MAFGDAGPGILSLAAMYRADEKYEVLQQADGRVWIRLIDDRSAGDDDRHWG